ncbi:hypothetical protein BGW80DRAFT_1278726 [Lactifluus volemus]|nr:hypothetical protein BGW80DRAFT_1278726 [Lactifluus volemus]
MMFVKTIVVLAFAILGLAAPIVNRNAEPGPLAVPRNYGLGVRDDPNDPCGIGSECRNGSSSPGGGGGFKI